MTKPHIRVFPHSREEFPSMDSLTTWLMTGLKARGGVYYMRSATSVKELPKGSVVLFRYADKMIVGEGLVTDYQKESSPGKTIAGKEIQYEARVNFAPTSLRIYSPPLPIQALQEIVGPEPNMIPSAQPYFRIEDWSVYPRVLAPVATQGLFL